jgi:hypothetical protein
MKTLESLEQICLQYKNDKTYLILLGDFNAQIQENKVGQKWNKRGTKLQSMCNKLKLVPVNYLHSVTPHNSRLCHAQEIASSII